MYIWYDDRFTQMKRSNAHERDSPSSSGDVVHVFMSSFSETADAESHRELHVRFSMYVCSKWNRTSVSFINRDAEHAGFIFKVFLRLNIYRY